MLGSIRDFFRRSLSPEAEAPGERGEHALRLAAAAHVRHPDFIDARIRAREGRR